MWVYEKNYAYLISLFRMPAPGSAESTQRWCTPTGRIVIDYLEQGPYTQLLDIHYAFQFDAPHLEALQFRVRVYHDACLAEVVSCQGMTRLLSRYTYPNPDMLHKDEKRQANYLLLDWLTSLQQSDNLPVVDEQLSRV
jgi:uncharacterized protein YqiB (DUF1249 family)